MQAKPLEEQEIADIAERLEGVLNGKTDHQVALRILDDLEREYLFLGEKTGRLQRLLKQRRIPDVSQWRVAVLSNISAIERLLRMARHARIEREAKERQFRVEMKEPLNWEASPVVYLAAVYVNDRYHSTIRCEITEEELARLPIGSRSLSKRQARWRRLNEYCRSFESGFHAHITRRWEEGLKLAESRRVTWTEVVAPRR